MRGRRQRANPWLPKALAARIKEDDGGVWASQRLDRINKRLWSQEHPRPTAIRLIVNRAVLPDPPGTQIVTGEGC